MLLQQNLRFRFFAAFLNWYLCGATIFVVLLFHLQIVNVEEDFLLEVFGEDVYQVCFLILETIIMWGYMILFFKKLGKIAVVVKTTAFGDFLYAFFSINKHMCSSL